MHFTTNHKFVSNDKFSINCVNGFTSCALAYVFSRLLFFRPISGYLFSAHLCNKDHETLSSSKIITSSISLSPGDSKYFQVNWKLILRGRKRNRLQRNCFAALQDYNFLYRRLNSGGKQVDNITILVSVLRILQRTVVDVLRSGESFCVEEKWC